MTRRTRPKNTKAGASQLHKTIPGPNKSTEINEIRNTSRNTNNLTKIRPPPIPYDPNAIFGGDSDEDPYDYSDIENVDNTRPPPLEEGYETDSSSQSLPWDSASCWLQDTNQDSIYDYDSDIDAALDAEFDKLHPISLAPVTPPYASRSAPTPNQKDLDLVIHQANLYMNRYPHSDASPLHQPPSDDAHYHDPRSELAMSAMVDLMACGCECSAATTAEDPQDPLSSLPSQTTLSLQPNAEARPTGAPLMILPTQVPIPTTISDTVLITDCDPLDLRMTDLSDDPHQTTDPWSDDLTQFHSDSSGPNSIYPTITAWRPWLTLPPRRPDKRPPRRLKPMKPSNFILDYSLSANLRPRLAKPLKNPKPTQHKPTGTKRATRGKPILPCPRRTPWTRRKKLCPKPIKRSTENRIFKYRLISSKIRKYRHTLPRNKQTSTSLDPHVFPTHAYWEMKAG